MPNDLDDWIRAAIAPTLRDRGYRGGPRRFRRRVPGFFAGIQFQGSSGNVLGLWRFTINFGVSHLGISRMTGVESPDVWQVSSRVSGKRDEDQWWDVGVGSDRARVAAAVLKALNGEILPYLEAASTPEGFRASIAAYPKPWGDDLVRQLDAAEAYDPDGDSRTPAQRRLDHMTSHPESTAWLAKRPEAIGLLEAASISPAAARAWVASHPDALKAFGAVPGRRPRSPSS